MLTGSHLARAAIRRQAEGGVIFLSSAHLIKQPNHLTSGARMQPSEDDPRSAPIAYLEGFSAILRLASYAFLFLGTLTLLIGLSTVSDVREFVNANCVGDCIGSCFPYRNATSYAGFHLARSLLLIFCAVSLLVAARSHLRMYALGGIALGILSLGVAAAISVDRGC